MQRLKDRVAIITGAGRGIGKAYVEVFAKEGAKVVIATRGDNGKELEEQLLAQGYDVFFVRCDVSQEDQIANVVNQAIEKYGRIDILVNNAEATSIGAHPRYIEDTPLDDVKLNWTVGFLGTYTFIKYCLPHMKKQGYGRIINTASATGTTATAGFSSYGSQKEAVRCLTKICAQEYGDYGITCNVVCPSVLSEGAKKFKELNPEKYAEAMKPNAIKRQGDAETEIAPVVVFLASEEASYVTAQTIGLDGGVTKM